MGCKTIGRFVTDVSTALAVAEGGNVPLNKSTVSNDCIGCDGEVVTISAKGVYRVSANFTFAATSAGNVETRLYRNGNAIPGAHAIDTVDAAGNGASQAIEAVVTVPGNSQTSLTFKALDATSVVVANVVVVKVA